MKKIFFLLFIIPAFSLAQYVGADFIVLNEGKESDYHQLEKVWKAYHQKSVDSGEKNWVVCMEKNS